MFSCFSSLLCIKKILILSDKLILLPEEILVLVLLDPERALQLVHLVPLVPWIVDSAWRAWILWNEKIWAPLAVLNHNRVH